MQTKHIVMCGVLFGLTACASDLDVERSMQAPPTAKDRLILDVKLACGANYTLLKSTDALSPIGSAVYFETVRCADGREFTFTEVSP